jgi:hypothetical protein
MNVTLIHRYSRNLWMSWGLCQMENITGGPCYIQLIDTKKLDSHITNSRLKRLTMTVIVNVGYVPEKLSICNLR